METSSGEAITALHMAEDLTARGLDVHFLASPFTARFLQESFPQAVTELTSDLETNRRLWDRCLASFDPDAVVFADYPLLFFSSGVAPLADDGWVASLEGVDALLVTLDHLGYAQRPMEVFFGPPHLSFHCETLPELPGRMEVLLPCPLQEPSPVPGRRGRPFRPWNLPLARPEGEIRAVRQRFLEREDDPLVFHSTPTWARRIAESFGLPYYQVLARLLEHYFEGLPRPVTVISVNGGGLLAPSGRSGVRVLDLATLPKSQYEALLFASDLVLTENKVSVTLGKAACAGVPAVVLKNSGRLLDLLDRTCGELRGLILEMERRRLGSVYPYEVFPIWSREDLDRLGLYRGNTLAGTFAEMEIWGGEETRERLHGLLTRGSELEALGERRRAYQESVAALEDAHDALAALAAPNVRETAGEAV